MKYKEQKNTVTGETRWVPVDGAKEGIGTFLKSAAEATGVPKSVSNIGALGATGLGAVQMLLNKPEAAEKSYGKALDLRRYAGTEGSFDQGVGSGMKTLFQGGKESAKTALTALGLQKAPIALAKTAGIGGVVGGTLSKLTGGTFSEGAGGGVGSAPATLEVTGLITKLLGKTKYVKNVSSEKSLINKIRQTIFPWENVAKTGGAKATEAAKASANRSMAKVWVDSIDEAVASSDPAQLNAIKSFASMGQDAQTKKAIMGASTEQLKTWAMQTKPITAIKALLSRRNFGKMASWKGFLQTLLNPGEASKSKAAKIMYNSLNTQLKTIIGVAQGDQMVANANLVGKMVKWLIALQTGKKGLSAVNKLL